jgi:[pyruvate, water dikinase]-phosphate phosphotransferase / [pyruvate, water dikinase] kinase
MDGPLDILVVSDATGATAEAVVTSVLAQFLGARARVSRFPFVRTVSEVEAVLAAAPSGPAIVIFTLVSPELRQAMLDGGAARNLAVVDLIGPLMAMFAGTLQHSPSQTPGIRSQERADLHEVTEAIHYTLRHDDGQGLETLHQADVIILGASRTGKTPTSIYLSCQKLRVANVPIVHPLPLPAEVLAAPGRKVGFQMALDRLVQLRSERPRRIGAGTLVGYSGAAAIFEELEYCEEVFRRIPGLRTIDVTTRSIEEIAEWIKRQVL